MLVYLQNLILEMIARGDGLEATTGRLCREVERLTPGVHCSVLEVDGAGLLHTVAGPSLAHDLIAGVEGVAIGAAVGSCGTAAFRKEEVTVTDVASDPLWHGFAELALANGYRACWSSPIFSYRGDVVGTFAFYYPDKRGPSQFEREIVAKCLQLCSIAFDREQRLRANLRLLFTDPLSGLSNRAAFEAAVAREVQGENTTALLLLDIDDLKLINDTFGHYTGDCLIRAVADRLAEIVGADRAFRLGGDELAVLTSAQQASGLANEILASLHPSADCGGHIIVPGVTIGIAVRDADDADGTTMRQNADLALYHGKVNERGRAVEYAPAFRSSMDRRLGAVAELRAALAAGRVEAWYQPIVRLDTQQVVHAEALCRIRMRDGTLLPAAAFQEAFADVRNGVSLTDTMLRHVAQAMRGWNAAGIAFGRVAVNLSAADFAHGKLVDRIDAIFTQAGVPLDQLMLEITENVYLGRRDRVVQAQLEALRARGVQLALDDFGTGYASLSHLLTTPVDVLKIDKSFVDHLADDGSQGAAVINGLMRIAEKLGIAVIVEGVETEAQRGQLMTLGVQLAQGYLFAPAQPAEAFVTLVDGSGKGRPEAPDGATLDRLRRAG